MSGEVEVLLGVDDALCEIEWGREGRSASGFRRGGRGTFSQSSRGESLFWLLGPGYAPRKRYLYTSLRFFLGISMLSGAVYQRRRRVYRVDYRPCGFGAKGRTPSAGWTERHGKAKSISPRAHWRARKTGPTARADACFDASRAEFEWGHPDGGTWTLFGSLTLAIGRGCKRESRTQRAGF